MNTAQHTAHIRWMIRRDMPEVLEIENRSFLDAWDEEEFIRHLRQKNCIGMVAERDERVVGYMIYDLHRRRLELLKLAVHPAFRRQRVGAQLVRKLIGKLSPQRRTELVAMVDDRLTGAHLFFRAAGMVATTVVRDWIDTVDNDVRDAYRFEYHV